MSNLSIFEKKWINIVFENRNKEYGAYKLRQENGKTTLFALLLGITFLSSFVFVLSSFGNHSNAIKNEKPTKITPIDLDDIYNPPTTEPEIVKPNLPSTNNTVVELINNLPLEVARQQDANPDVATNKELPTTNITDNSNGSDSNNGNLSTTGNSTGNEEDKLPKPQTLLTTATVDVKPDFPGGMAKFYKYVGNNFERVELNGEGSLTVYISFIVEKDGTLTDITVIRNPGYGLDKEAIRVLKSLKTRWIPGKIKGQPVRTQFTLPIKVQTE